MEVIRIGSRGDAVITLQSILNQNGFTTLVDGIFGAGTEDRVEQFQEKHNLTVDGVVGRSTWDVLLNVGGKPKNNINSTRFILPPENYYSELFTKKTIVLHHTNGWAEKNGKPSMNHFYWWKSHYGSINNRAKVATAFSIDTDGNIYQHFDPKYWAYHLGLGKARNYLDKQSIGIELVNEGQMTKDSNGKFHWYSGEVAIPYNRVDDEPVYVEKKWRGYNWFAPYTEEQIKATLWLVEYLSKNYGIKMNFIEDCEYRPDLLSGNFEGIYNHANVRDYPSTRPKWDLSPAFPFKRFGRELTK